MLRGFFIIGTKYSGALIAVIFQGYGKKPILQLRTLIIHDTTRMLNSVLREWSLGHFQDGKESTGFGLNILRKPFG